MVRPISGFNIANYYSYVQNMTGIKPANSGAPLRLFSPNLKFESQIGGFTTGAKEVVDSYSRLNEAARSVSPDDKGTAFNQRAVNTGNSSAISAAAAEGEKIGKSYSIEVSQTAQAQKNAGAWQDANTKWLDSNADSPVKESYTIQFQDAQGQNGAKVSFEAKGGESTKQVLERAANAINASGATSASVETKTVNGVEQARLVIASNKSGPDGAFSVKDSTGNFTSKAGVANATTSAQKAKYTVDGKAYESQSNEIKLDNSKISVVIKGVTKPGEAVNIKVTPDVKGLALQVAQFVDEYNKSVKSLNDNGSYVNKKVLDLTKLASQDRIRLEDAGISVRADGSLRVDEKKLEASLRANFQGTKNAIGGLAEKVEQKTSVIVNTPVASYANQNFLKLYKTGSLFDISA